MTEFLLDGASSRLLESLQGRLGLSIDAISRLKLLGHKKDTGENQKCEGGSLEKAKQACGDLS